MASRVLAGTLASLTSRGRVTPAALSSPMIKPAKADGSVTDPLHTLSPAAILFPSGGHVFWGKMAFFSQLCISSHIFWESQGTEAGSSNQ